MNKWASERADGRINERTNKQTNEQASKRATEQYQIATYQQLSAGRQFAIFDSNTTTTETFSLNCEKQQPTIHASLLRDALLLFCYCMWRI